MLEKINDALERVAACIWRLQQQAWRGCGSQLQQLWWDETIDQATVKQ